MSQPPARNLLLNILKNFVNSLKPRRLWGDLKGVDHFGNKYYEVPINEYSRRSRPERYFEPPVGADFDQEMSAEWESWLRYRRRDPPSDEEIARNLAIMEMKKKNAVIVDAKGGKKTPQTKGMESFPVRPEYEMVPGYKKS